MRKETRFALGILGLSAVATSYVVGHQASEAPLALSASALNQPAATEPATASEGAVGPSDTATSDPTAKATTEPEPTVTATAKPTAQPSPSATATKTAEPAPSAATQDGVYQSSNVSYRYGTIQLEIVVASGKLSEINLLRATTEGRGYDQAPPMLVTAALEAGSADFANLSGATFTTMAFKQALTDALNQAGL